MKFPKFVLQFFFRETRAVTPQGIFIENENSTFASEEEIPTDVSINFFQDFFQKFSEIFPTVFLKNNTIVSWVPWRNFGSGAREISK